jgi:ElaB/YqjD/DUF883 family membrane-anchored ribosome-binding protein
MKAGKLKHEGEILIERGSKIAKDLQKNAKSYGKVAVNYVKQHPVQSTLIAVTVGIILGKIFKR